MNFEYVKQYYGVPAELGRDVVIGGKTGTITSDQGNYIGVTFHDDKRKYSLPCHPTSEVVYLDTFSDLKRFRPTRSQERYRQYLSEDYSGSFGEYLKELKNRKCQTPLY